MTTETVLATRRLPRVNLLPPEIGQARRAKQAQAGLAAVVVLAAVGMGALYQHAHSQVGAAQRDLDAATQQHQAAQVELTRYAGVTQIKNQAQAEQAQLTTAMGGAVLWSHYMNDLSLTMPGNVWFTQISFALKAPTGTTTTPALPGAPTAIGQVTLTGQGLSHNDVASLLNTLAATKGYANPFFTMSSEQAVANTTKLTDQFNVTSDVTSDALCGSLCSDIQVGG